MALDNISKSWILHVASNEFINEVINTTYEWDYGELRLYHTVSAADFE